jgi:hypothetical protein
MGLLIAGLLASLAATVACNCLCGDKPHPTEYCII